MISIKNNFIILFLLIFSNTFSQDKLYKITEPLKIPRQMYGTVILGDYIYIIGGNIQGQGDNPEGYVTSVEKAKINPDGTLGKWEATTSLPRNRCYINNSTLALNDIVYVVMGTEGVGGTAAKTIFWTKPRADGNLEPWRESIPYPGPGLKLVTAVTTPGYLNVIGGKDTEKKIYSDVWSAKIGADGSVIGWERGNPIPIPLFFHCSAVAGGRVWCWGGLLNDSMVLNNKVFVAPILSSGKIGEWTFSGSTLPSPLYTAAVSVSGNYLLTFCPRYNPNLFTSDIWYAQVLPTGLTEWKKITTDISTKLYIGVATDYRRGYVYIPGGRINQDENPNSLDGRVYYFKLSGQQVTDVKTDSTNTENSFSQSGGNENLSYTQQNTKSIASPPGFYNYEQARQIAQTKKIPMVLYFYTHKASKCIEQTSILQKYNPLNYSNKIIFAEANAIYLPQIAQQYGVFRIPCWIFFDSTGNVKFRQQGVLQIAQLENYLQQITQ